MPAMGKGWLRLAIEDFLQTFRIGQVISAWLEDIAQPLEQEIAETHADMGVKLAKDARVPKSIRDLISGAGSALKQGGLPGAVGFAANLGMSAASGLMAPVMRYLNYGMDREMRTARMDPGVAFPMARRLPEFAPKLLADLTDLGWDDDLIKVWETATLQVVPENMLLQIMLRHPNREGEITAELQGRGWTADRIAILKELVQQIPGIGDLIRMAVREAWSEEVVARFEYDADYPAAVEEWAAKQGLGPEWVKRFWRAHWELPGIVQGFEMLHRLRPGTTDIPFELEDLRTLLRTADIPRYFRDRLIAISYSPYTRVDVRRLYKERILTREQVKSNYLDIGYDEEHAENLTKFTVLDVATEERGLTRDNIIAGYKRGLMSVEETRTSLIDIGYDPDNAAYFVAIADYDLAKTKANDVIDQAEFLYTAGEIDSGGVYGILGPYNLPAKQVADLIVKWDVAIRKKRTLPSVSDLEDFYRRNVITADLLRDGLKKRRYIDQDIEYYMIRLDQKLAEETAKELERAQKEQERILLATKASEYAKAKANLEVQIAEINLQIADLKVSVHELTEADDIAAVATYILEAKAMIAALQLEKAQIRVEAL